MTVARAEGDKCCNEVAGHPITITDFENIVEQAVTRRLILGKVKEVKASKKEGYINVSIYISYDMVFWNFKKTETINIVVNGTDNPDYLRKVHVIADELEQIVK